MHHLPSAPLLLRQNLPLHHHHHHLPSLIDYVSPDATTLSAIQRLFNIKNLRSILGADALPLDTPANYLVASKQTLKIPLPCACCNSTGRSNRRPVYRVVPGNGLDHIARDVFAGLVVYREIQDASNIYNPNLIDIRDDLWISLQVFKSNVLRLKYVKLIEEA